LGLSQSLAQLGGAGVLRRAAYLQPAAELGDLPRLPVCAADQVPDQDRHAARQCEDTY